MTTDLLIPKERDLPSGRLLQRKEHLVRELTLAPHSDSGGRRRRRWALAALVPAVLLVGGWTSYLMTRPAEEVVEGIVCADEPSLYTSGTVVGSDGRHPSAICAERWAQGDVGNAGTPSRDVPPLVACVGPRKHYVWVFPSPDPEFCAALGLQDLPDGYRDAAPKFAAMRADLAQRFGFDRGDPCVLEADARRIARETLDDHGFTDWSVTTAPNSGQGFTEEEPCADLFWDSVNRELMLVPWGGPIG